MSAHTGCSIAPATSPAHLADIDRLYRAYAESLGVDLAYQEFEAELASLPGKYAPPRGALLIARADDGTAIGCGALRPLEGATCEMKRLYVAPAARGLGLGRALMEALLTAARDAGYRTICLDTLPSLQTALALYRRAGFREIAPYYDTPIAGTNFLALDL